MIAVCGWFDRKYEIGMKLTKPLNSYRPLILSASAINIQITVRCRIYSPGFRKKTKINAFNILKCR